MKVFGRAYLGLSLLSGWLVAANGCALTSRSEPMQVRYFSADAAARAAGPAAPRQGRPNLPVELRLERVRASSHLGESIAYRTGAHELGYYETARWTERPEAFLERALERALFQERGLTRVLGGRAETLAVELVAFEEVRGPQPLARLEASIILHDERASQLEQTITVERPIGSRDADPASRAVTALSGVLQEAVEKIADQIAERLTAIAAHETQTVQPAEAVSAQ